jgi:hypothetical protein
MNEQQTLRKARAKTRIRPISLAKALAPEDIEIGDFIAVLHSSREFPKYTWNSTPSSETVKVSYIPSDGGIPHRVKAICLPFVYVKHPSGLLKVLDVRVSQMARLGKVYAKTAWKAHKRRLKKRRPSNFPD